MAGILTVLTFGAPMLSCSEAFVSVQGGGTCSWHGPSPSAYLCACAWSGVAFSWAVTSQSPSLDLNGIHFMTAVSCNDIWGHLPASPKDVRQGQAGSKSPGQPPTASSDTHKKKRKRNCRLWSGNGLFVPWRLVSIAKNAPCPKATVQRRLPHDSGCVSCFTARNLLIPET
jgi:hypothetical protein